MRKVTLITLCALLGIFFNAKAQDSTATEETGKLTITGYVDAYYTYNFNNPPHLPGLAFENKGRIFDIKHNEFSLGLAQTKFAYAYKNSEVVVDLVYGPNAALGNFGNIIGGADLFIKQAYLSHTFADKLTFTIGQFGTHIGYELIDAPLNFNYSLSYLFGNGPFYHTGAKLSYAFSDNFGVMAGIFNGWDAMYDFNEKKSFGAQIFVAPVEDWSVYINYIGGDEKNGLSFPTIASIPDSVDVSTPSHLFDLTTTYQVSEKFKVGLNAAFGTGKLLPDTTVSDGFSNASWFGAALYLNYSVSDKFGLGLRAEHFNDEDGVRYFGATSVNEFTLTGDIKLAGGHFNIKPEFRIDIAKDEVFGKFDSDGVFDKATKTQATLGAAFIYSF